jgi:hypothetical protein
MVNPEKAGLVRWVLLTNGIADLIAAIALFFPLLDLPLPGYSDYTNEIAFVAGGWGIAALTFGIGRIWSSYRPEFYFVMAVLGLLEGSVLTAFCLINVLFFDISFIQAIMPLSIGSIFGALYLLSLIRNNKNG